MSSENFIEIAGVKIKISGLSDFVLRGQLPAADAPAALTSQINRTLTHLQAVATVQTDACVLGKLKLFYLGGLLKGV